MLGLLLVEAAISLTALTADTWYWATSNQPWVLGGVFLNTFVHTFMYRPPRPTLLLYSPRFQSTDVVGFGRYYYYCVSLFGVKPWWKKHLTKLQISQFAMGAPCASLYLHYHLLGNQPRPPWFGCQDAIRLNDQSESLIL